MKTNRIKVRVTKPPTVTLDTEARAAYIQLTKKAVVKTKELSNKNGILVVADYDAAGQIVGVELIGVVEFTVEYLVKQSHLDIPKKLQQKTRLLAA